MDVGAWLGSLGLAQYADAFVHNEIDGDVLATLTTDDLKDIGITVVGHRRRILDAIARLGEVAPTTRDIEPVARVGLAPSHRAAAERRRVTVLFCDLVGSTSLAGRLDPEEYRETLFAYQNAVAGEITRLDGQVAKFMGDGVLAFFGYPRAVEDSAERAVRAGLRLTQVVGELRDPQGRPLASRVGIATGLVVIGDLVGDGMAEPHAISGDTPNLAARLQDHAGAGGVIISDGTRELVGDLFDLEEHRDLHMKGFDSPVTAWKILREGRAQSRFHAFHSRGLRKLVGRDEELALLVARWQQVAAGEGQAVFLAGDAGIGKSRLVEELVTHLDPPPVGTVRLFGSHLRSQTAFYPLITEIERRTGALPGDEQDHAARLLAPVFGDEASVVASLFSVGAVAPTLAELGPQDRKARLIEALVGGLARWDETGPVMVAVEDAHWLDPSSQEWLESLLRQLPQLCALVLVTFRPGYAPPTGFSLARETVLTVTRLPPAASRALIQEVAGGRTLPPEIVDQVLAKTEGVPIFVEELTKMIVESGQLRDCGDHYELTAPLDHIGIPATLHDSLMSRLDRLDHGKEIAQIGAVIGRDFSYEVLRAALPRAIDPGAGLDELVESGLVLRTGDLPDAFFTFKHVLVQDAAYGSLVSSTRRDLHRRVATYLVERHDLREITPEVIARHFSEAGMPRQAVEHWLLAGQRAIERSQLREACRDLERGIEIISELPDRDAYRVPEVRLQTALGTALIMLRGQGAPEVMRAYQRAWELCEQVPDDGQLFPPLFGLYRFGLAQGGIGNAYDAAVRLSAIAERNGDPTMQIASETALCLSQFHLGELAAARRHADSGRTIYETHAQTHGPHSLFMIGQDPRVACLSCDALSSALLGDLDRARDRVTQALSIARAEAHLFSLGAAMTWTAFIAYLRGDSDAISLAGETIAMASRNRFGMWEGLARVVLGACEMSSGDPAGAEQEIACGVDLLDDAGTLLFRPFAFASRAEALLRLGDHATALELTVQGLEMTTRRRERWYNAELHRVRAEALRTLPGGEDIDGAGRELAAAREVARALGERTLELRVATTAALWLAGEGDRLAAARELAPAVESMGTTGAPVVKLAVEALMSLSASV